MPESSKPDHVLRAETRERVVAAARRGQQPDVYFDLDDLAWAFQDHQHELEEHRQTAHQAQLAEAESKSARERQDDIRSLADRIESEWIAKERADRRARAEAEARRQLGTEAA